LVAKDRKTIFTTKHTKDTKFGKRIINFLFLSFVLFVPFVVR